MIKSNAQRLRYIHTTYPEKWDELIQTITTTSTDSDFNGHCKRNLNRRLKVNINQNKNYILKEKPVLYSSVYLCTRFAYLYHATIECSVSRYYDMIWNHTGVSTSLFTYFPYKNFFNGHHSFSKYIADEKRILPRKIFFTIEKKCLLLYFKHFFF